MRIYALLSLFLFSTLSFSMDWPSPNGVAARNFGWNNEGQPVLGISFESEGPIMAAEQGELLFQHDIDHGASRLSSPLGSWLALDHGGGIIGVYSRMAENGRAAIFEPPVSESIAKNDPIGESGTSGMTDKKGVYFSLFDRKERRWINPTMIVTALPDSGIPQILSVQLRNSEGAILNMAEARIISQGRHTILVHAAEIFQGTNRSPLAPFRITCSVNGSEIGRLSFETYSARDGSLMVYRNGLVPVRQIYAPFPAFELGTASFTRGQVTMEIIVQNAAGTSRSAVYRFTVD